MSHLTASIACNTGKVELTSNVSSNVTKILFADKFAMPHSKQTLASIGPLKIPNQVGSADYSAHPAQADAVLHLGAVGKNSANSAMVPVGLSALGSDKILNTEEITSWAVSGMIVLSFLIVLLKTSAANSKT